MHVTNWGSAPTPFETVIPDDGLERRPTELLDTRTIDRERILVSFV